MKSRIWFSILLVAVVSVKPLPVRAGDAARVASYALVIGSNRPGKGQEALSFAKRDADRFGTVLRELGGFPSGSITTLYDPTPQGIRGALDKMRERVSRHAAAGEQTAFVFYYSGHARSSALNLGNEEISLTEIRTLIGTVPAQLTLVVLDACQTGAYSKVKGVAPAADFSYNSVAGLNQEGTVVIASSAASELAQESERLRGSFFTHHLVAALRGAADVNGDGVVTLDEAYRYAYNRTLVDTAKTAVGKQHVTLETALRGKGETVLSRPGTATAWLTLPREMSAEALIYRASDRQVVAEVHKASGREMTLALPPASYEVVVRRGKRAYACKTPIGKGTNHTLKLETCDRIRLEEPGTKGSGHRRTEHLFFEVGFGAQWGKKDAYNNRLNDFGLEGNIEGDPILHFGAVGYWSPLRYLKVGLQYSFLDDDDYEGDEEHFSWRAQRISLLVRGVLPLANDWLALYAQAGFGVAWAKTSYSQDGAGITLTDTPVSVYDEERFAGWCASGGGGVQLLPWQYAGFFWQAEYVFAPVIENLLGDTHDSGGVAVTTGFMGGF